MARILVAGFCTVPGPHRAGVQLPHALRALAERHTVEVLVVRKGDQPYVEPFRGTRVLRVPVGDGDPRAQIAGFRRALRRQLEGADYDAVHVRDGWSGVPVLELRRRLEYAVIFDAARGPMAQAPVPDSALADELVRAELSCVASADLVLAATEPALRWLAAHGGGERVQLVPPGVDIDLFDWDLAPERGPARIFYGGLIRRGRGLRVLLRAMVEVCARTDARLVLAGPVDAGFAPIIHGDIAELGLGERVEFLGALDNDEMPTAIAQATVCVAPEALELAGQPTALYPTKLLEYMACRRVALAPRRGTVAMLMADGEHGLQFAPGDPVDLAAQILRLLADAGLRDRLARAAYDRVRQQHSASGTRRALRLAYRQLARPLAEDSRDPRPHAAVGSLDDDTHEVTEAAGHAAAHPRGRDAHGRPVAQAPEDVTSVELPAAHAGRATSEHETAPPSTSVGAARPTGPDDRAPTDRTTAPRSATTSVESDFAAGELDIPTSPGAISIGRGSGSGAAAGAMLSNSPREFDDDAPTGPRETALADLTPARRRVDDSTDSH